ncbi:MAG TPA: SDR family oxidoreductase [Candidatus Thermoplasmatota archaeon]|nr:SDR family oxidoreductase [Candidatus Thermoplasmatota archaeon]
MPPRLPGKRILVTGGASGIGRATATLCAAEGARVVVGDIDAEGGAAVVEEVAAAGGDARFVRCDVRSALQVEGLVRSAVEAFGGLDGAFNDAGIWRGDVPLADTSEAEFDDILAVNLRGVWLCMRAELAVLAAQGRGAIVNCSSVAGITGFEGSSAYSASKHGVLGLTRSAALECAKRGVRVNAVCPGAIRTPMLADLPAEVIEALADAHPLGRIGEPREVASAVVWLLSDEASFVTGHALAVDGGLLAE